MSNLYQIRQDLIDLFNTIEENDGELTSELEEQLSIKQDEFKDKIKSYTDVIKQLSTDINAIKEEKCRLSDLQKSKEHTIDKLKEIMSTAILQFGDSTKSGSKFVDFGTGKVSLRHSDSIEVDEDGLKQFVNRFCSYFSWLKYTNTFDQTNIDCKEIADYCNKVADNPTEDSVVTNYTDNDMMNINTDLTIRANLMDIVSKPAGKNLIKAILDYNTTFSSKPVIDKTAIKNEFKSNGDIPNFANYISKENVIIK